MGAFDTIITALHRRKCLDTDFKSETFSSNVDLLHSEKHNYQNSSVEPSFLVTPTMYLSYFYHFAGNQFINLFHSCT